MDFITTTCFILGVAFGWMVHSPHHTKKNVLELDARDWRCVEWTEQTKGMQDFDCTEYKRHDYDGF
jgi:hypothetical protein